jgi:hypothetical protein
MSKELKKLLRGTDQPNLTGQQQEELFLKNLILGGLKSKKMEVNKKNAAAMLFKDGNPENYEGEIPQWYRELPD